MRHRIWILICGLLAIASACSDDLLLGKIPRKDTVGQGGHRNPPDEETNSEKHDTSTYICAVEFPKGYDWQRDTAYGLVESNLVVFRNGTRIITVPVGGQHLVSRDPDMHRVVDGHLYTDYVIDNHTIIKMDGKELFRYSGAESLCGFIVRGDEIWTLGLPRAEQGFALRKNGKSVYASDIGIVNGSFANQSFPGGALHEDSGSICFAYYDLIINSATGTIKSKTWHIVKDGAAEDIIPPHNISNIVDVRMAGSKLCLAAEESMVTIRPVLVEGGTQYQIGDKNVHKIIRNCRIAVSKQGPCIKEEESFDGGNTFVSALLMKDGTKIRTTWPMIAREFYMSEGTTAYVESFEDDRHIGNIVVGEKQYPIANRLRLMTNASAKFIGKHFVAGMSPYTPEETPKIWDNGKITPLNINGYITSITYTVKE